MLKKLIAIIFITAMIFVMAYFLAKIGFEISTSRIMGTRVNAESLSFNIFKWQANIKNINIYHPSGFEKGIMSYDLS